MIPEWAVKKKLFKNTNHVLWFMMSIYIYLAVLAYFFLPDKVWLIWIPIIFHAFVILQALYTTVVKNEESETLSKDCIWFNTLMFVLYLTIAYIKYAGIV